MPIDQPEDPKATSETSPRFQGVGWWRKSLGAAPSSLPRRAVLQGILVAGGVVAGLTALPEEAAAQDPEVHHEPRVALEMQRVYGWSFGAAMESLTFDGASVQPFDRTALARLPDDLRPARLRHAPFYVPTLFQSPSALPRAVPAGDAVPIVPLKDALRPIFTPAMAVAYRRGQALASLFRHVYAKAAVVVDLPGPEAVAFAAGAADVLDPVFLFDNWPHPRGVVPAHLTLAAAVYYQPLFARHAAPPAAPPMFVLDRSRLAAYTDDDNQFDNRHVARLPSAAALQGIDVSHVLYVSPTAADVVEMDDLNDDFMAYAAAGLDVKIIAADAFGPDPAAPGPLSTPYDPPLHRPGCDENSAVYQPECRTGGGQPYYYGHTMGSHGFFWLDYPWLKPLPFRGPIPRQPAFPRPGCYYHPAARMTSHSSPVAHAGVKYMPPGFGYVNVVVSARTGAILGASGSRSGSWGRAGSSSAGG